MACKNITTLLGYEDEPVTEKNKTFLHFTTNKVGGLPDSPSDQVKIEPPTCPLCQLPRILIVQVYAPIDATQHRTLYVFACINPNCWNQTDSWFCLRAQTVDTLSMQHTTQKEKTTNASATDWCHDADDWDDDNATSLTATANQIEENGNLISKSDDDDESASLDESMRMGMELLEVDDNDKNANAQAQGGAVGNIHSPTASAEIEGAEGEVVSIDTPTYPQRDIAAVLNDVAHLPHELFQQKSPVHFDAFFMNVYEEQTPNKNTVDRHVRELLQEYQAHHDDINLGGGGVAVGGQDGGDLTMEKYEKSNPAHGDKMFHYFLTKIRQNPGHFLRYSRAANPLLMYPIQPHDMKKCRHCQGELTFEFQLLPTLIPLLRLNGDAASACAARLEFGNVLIYTCAQNCHSGETSIRHEHVIVQSERM